MKIGCLIALMAAFAFPLAAEVVSNVVFPVTLEVDAATCPLIPPGIDSISGSGELTILIRTTTSPSGTVHVGVTAHGHGKAIDSNGDEWTWSDADYFFGSNEADGFSEMTITEGFHLIGKKGDKVLVKSVFHVTVVDGNIIVSFARGNESEENELCEGFVGLP